MTGMSKWEEEQERRRDDKERRRVSREMFGKFFYQGLLVIIGFCLTCILASISYYIMKY